MNNACVHLLKSYSLPLSQVGQVFGRKPCAGDALFAFLRPTSIDKQARRFLSGAASSLGCAPYEVNTLKRRRIDSVETFRPYTDVQPFHTTAIRLIRKPIHRPAAPSSPRASANGRNVPIPFGNIGKKELDKIFEHDILYEEGNKMLQILHSRRVTGALVDQGVHIKGTHTVPLEALTKALDWLRAKYPVDEQSAADAWAQQEAKRLEETYIARAEKLGLYKPLDAEEQTTELSTNSVYGNNSVLDEFKRFHEERRKREAKEKKESGEEQRSQELQMAKRVEAEQAQETRMKIIEERRELRAKKGMVTEEMPVPDVTLVQKHKIGRLLNRSNNTLVSKALPVYGVWSIDNCWSSRDRSYIYTTRAVRTLLLKYPYCRRHHCRSHGTKRVDIHSLESANAMEDPQYVL